jgi:16S rRNA (guanine966-N2)-methyltransferase
MVREAVFSALAARNLLVDASVADLYAGSGALGIEALSRGAAHAVFVDTNRAATTVVSQNLEACGFNGSGRVVRGDALRFLAGPEPRGAPFTLVFADPPYTTPDPDVEQLLRALATTSHLAADATVVVERPAGADVRPPASLPATWERAFGDTLVVFLRH